MNEIDILIIIGMAAIVLSVAIALISRAVHKKRQRVQSVHPPLPSITGERQIRFEPIRLAPPAVEPELIAALELIEDGQAAEQLPRTAASSPAIRIVSGRASQMPRRRVPKVPGPPMRLSHREPAHWEEKGWRKRGNTYHGEFKAGSRSWRGSIKVPFARHYAATIWNPPMRELSAQRHPHRPCFQHKGGQAYNIHFHHMPHSLDHAITCIERILRDVTPN